MWEKASNGDVSMVKGLVNDCGYSGVGIRFGIKVDTVICTSYLTY